MKAKLRRVAKSAYAALALALASAGLVPMLYSHAFAYGQVTTRSIKMSSAKVNATSVSYLVTFSPATTATAIHGIAVDFCSNDPLPGDTCTLPASFDVTATPTVTGTTIPGESSCSFTASGANNTPGYRTLILDDSACTGTPSGAAASFTVSTVHNPNTLGTFYARIFTFGTSGQAATWAAASSGDGSSTTNVVDAGGVALSTVSDINITARVMEQITFCTSSTDISASTCASATAPVNLTIGHAVGTTTAIDSSAVDAASAWTQLSTNATNGAIVRMKDLTIGAGSCGGLTRDNGVSCEIPGEGVLSGSPLTASAITKGTAEFGMCVVPNISGSGVVKDAPYDDGGATNCAATTTPAMTGNDTTALYGLDDSTSNDNVVSTYGDTVYHTAAPVNQTTSALNFAATASLTTPAGIYSQSESLIATGSF